MNALGIEKDKALRRMVAGPSVLQRAQRGVDGARLQGLRVGPEGFLQLDSRRDLDQPRRSGERRPVKLESALAELL